MMGADLKEAGYGQVGSLLDLHCSAEEFELGSEITGRLKDVRAEGDAMESAIQEAHFRITVRMD